ncbi:MAG: hypothetical protein IKG52_16180 [Rhodobacteraceae bacterium]|nr:hypothetical protein [Paracoccaceae bacterium]
MTTDTDENTGPDPLDLFFDAARDEATAVSPQLRARILADASSVQASANRPQHASLWQRLRVWFGGWTAPSLAGGLTAAAAGFWFGVAPPCLLPRWTRPFGYKTRLFILMRSAPRSSGWMIRYCWGFDIWHRQTRNRACRAGAK